MDRFYVICNILIQFDMTLTMTWPCVHKAVQNKDQDQVLILWTFFKTYNNYLTIDRWCLIRCTTNKTSWNSTLFLSRKRLIL